MIKVPLLRHQRYISPSPLTPRVKTNNKMYKEKKFNFDTFDVHVMVNYIETNLQEIIFGPIRVGLITQKQFWDHLKNCHSWGQTPYPYYVDPLFILILVGWDAHKFKNPKITQLVIMSKLRMVIHARKMWPKYANMKEDEMLCDDNSGIRRV